MSQDISDIIWQAGVDNDAYQVTVRTIDGFGDKAQLVIKDMSSGLIAYGAEVVLHYQDGVGLDARDLAAWQDIVINWIDSQDK